MGKSSYTSKLLKPGMLATDRKRGRPQKVSASMLSMMPPSVPSGMVYDGYPMYGHTTTTYNIPPSIPGHHDVIHHDVTKVIMPGVYSVPLSPSGKKKRYRKKPEGSTGNIMFFCL